MAKKLVINITDSAGSVHSAEAVLPEQTAVTNDSFTLSGTTLTLTDSNGNAVDVDLAPIQSDTKIVSVSASVVDA